MEGRGREFEKDCERNFGTNKHGLGLRESEVEDIGIGGDKNIEIVVIEVKGEQRIEERGFAIGEIEGGDLAEFVERNSEPINFGESELEPKSIALLDLDGMREIDKHVNSLGNLQFINNEGPNEVEFRCVLSGAGDCESFLGPGR